MTQWWDEVVRAMGELPVTRDDSQSWAGLVRGAAPDCAYLRVVHPPPARDVLIDRTVTLGRDADLIFDDSRMSKVHASVGRDEDRWCVRDLGSRNGTFVDGRRLEAQAVLPLADGALLRLGDTLAVFRERDIPLAGADTFLPGRAPALLAAREALSRLAARGGPALVLGETGTGKEYAARAFHALVAPGAPLVAVNCAELDPALARAELFGTERGIYTGAEKREGLLAAAGEGVLFLDEVGELDPSVQADLLRVLDDGRYRAVGGSEQRTSAAHLVAATHVDLDAAVAAGRFRRDLLARLRRAGEPVVLPPLRQRREDLLWWAERLLGHARWATGFAEALLLAEWLENLRGLEAVLRTCSGDPLGLEALPANLRDRLLQARQRPELDAPAQPSSFAAPPSRDVLEAALRARQGNVREAARALGLERTRLYRLCRELGLDLASFRGP